MQVQRIYSFLMLFLLIINFLQANHNKIKLKTKFLNDFINEEIIPKSVSKYINLHLNCWKDNDLKVFMQNHTHNIFLHGSKELKNASNLVVDVKQRQRIYNVLDYDCAYEIDYFTAVLTNMRTCGYQGLILCDVQHFDKLVHVLTHGHTITVMSLVIIAKFTNSNVELLQIHRISQDYPIGKKK